MPQYEFTLDKERATPEQRIRYSDVSAVPQTTAYKILNDLGYNISRFSMVGAPLFVTQPISEEHMKVLEERAGFPLRIREVPLK